MAFGHLDQAQLGAVGILDPALDQPPRHARRGLADRHPGGDEPPFLGPDVTDLHPQGDVAGARGALARRDLEEAATEEVHDAGGDPAGAVLAGDRQPEGALVELAAPGEVPHPQDEPAAEDVHAASLAGRARAAAGSGSRRIAT
jgi:hypothetical protein